MNCSFVCLCSFLFVLVVLSECSSLRDHDSKVRSKRQSSDYDDVATSGGGGCGGRNSGANGRMKNNPRSGNRNGNYNNRGGGRGSMRPPFNGTSFGNFTPPMDRIRGPPLRNFSSNVNNGFRGNNQRGFVNSNTKNLMHPKPIEVSGSLEILEIQGDKQNPLMTRAFASSSSSVSNSAGNKMITAMHASSA